MSKIILLNRIIDKRRKLNSVKEGIPDEGNALVFLFEIFDRGLKHPDDMSAAILELYWDYLNGIDERWKAFDAKKGE